MPRITENKTKPTRASVADYIASRANARQRTDWELMALFKEVNGRSADGRLIPPGGAWFNAKAFDGLSRFFLSSPLSCS
jgi:hypothetical protein